VRALAYERKGPNKKEFREGGFALRGNLVVVFLSLILFLRTRSNMLNDSKLAGHAHLYSFALKWFSIALGD
jgi:hypothetical protein